jgi:SAM-dependent methyltransferase
MTPVPPCPVKTRKLHIGCGKNYLPPSEGWVNHDLFSVVKADVYADMSALPFERRSFDLVYSSHCLEHCHRHSVVATLAHWYDLLKPGGTIRLAVPNFAAICAHYAIHEDIKILMGLLYGGQTTAKNYHTTSFDEHYLRELLTSVGFVNVRWWDWRLTEHAAWDDYASCYLPHMQKDNGGRLMSLNLEADRPL